MLVTLCLSYILVLIDAIGVLCGTTKGGVVGGEDVLLTPSLNVFLWYVDKTSPGLGGGIDEPPELKDDATESVESAPVLCDMEVGVTGI